MAGAPAPSRENRRARRRPASGRAARPAAAHGRGVRRPARRRARPGVCASALVGGRGKWRNSQSQCATTQVRSARLACSAAKSSRRKIVQHGHAAGEVLPAGIAPFAERRQAERQTAEDPPANQPVFGRADGFDAHPGKRCPRFGKAVDALVEHVIVGERQHQALAVDPCGAERIGQERGGHRMVRSRRRPERSAHAARPPALRNCRRRDRPTRSAAAAARRPRAPRGSPPPRCRRGRPAVRASRGAATAAQAAAGSKPRPPPPSDGFSRRGSHDSL